MTGLLTRKVNRGKWEAGEGLAPDEISADAVTGDLRTTGNALSFWTCSSSDVSALNETVLAVASAYDGLDRVDIAWVPREDVDGAGLVVRESPENAHIGVESLKRQHVDIVNLDVVRLGKVATLIRSAVAKSQVKRFPKGAVLKVIVAAVKEERLTTDQLKTKLRDEVEKELQKSRHAVDLAPEDGGLTGLLPRTGRTDPRSRTDPGSPASHVAHSPFEQSVPAQKPIRNATAQPRSKISRASAIVSWVVRWFR